MSRPGFPGSLPGKQKQGNTATSRFRRKQTCLKNLRGDQPQDSSQGQRITSRGDGRKNRKKPRQKMDCWPPQPQRLLSWPLKGGGGLLSLRHPDQGRGKFFTGPMPGAAEGKAKGSGGPALWTLGYTLPPTPSLLPSSLGSGRQQDSVWEPADPVIAVETPLLASFILCGFWEVHLLLFPWKWQKRRGVIPWTVQQSTYGGWAGLSKATL